MGEVKLNHCVHRRYLTVDDSKVWVHSPGLAPLGWNFEIPVSSPVQLFDMPSPYFDGTKLWDICLLGPSGTVARKVIFQLGRRFAQHADAQWDGRYLVAGYESGEILILDFKHVLSQ
jgi:hypothetical protein